jgi:hypothetical protein
MGDRLRPTCYGIIMLSEQLLCPLCPFCPLKILVDKNRKEAHFDREKFPQMGQKKTEGTKQKIFSYFLRTTIKSSFLSLLSLAKNHSQEIDVKVFLCTVEF